MLRHLFMFVSVFFIVAYSDKPSPLQPLPTEMPTDGNTPPPTETTPPTEDGQNLPTPAVDSGHPDGAPGPKGKDGGKGNPRNKHVESLANTIAKFQAAQNGGGSS